MQHLLKYNNFMFQNLHLFTIATLYESIEKVNYA